MIRKIYLITLFLFILVVTMKGRAILQMQKGRSETWTDLPMSHSQWVAKVKFQPSAMWLENPPSSSKKKKKPTLPMCPVLSLLRTPAKRPVSCLGMAAVTCWWVRPQRQRAPGTGPRPSPQHTPRLSSWALEWKRKRGWHLVVKTLLETPLQRHHYWS